LLGKTQSGIERVLTRSKLEDVRRITEHFWICEKSPTERDFMTSMKMELMNKLIEKGNPTLAPDS
jgi:hypothetical protein